MKRTNSVTDALNTNKVLVDVGDGIVIPLPTDGVFGGAQGKPGVGVPDGGTSGQVVQRTASGTIWATPSKDLVGLTKVDNTADLEKPLSEPQALALTNKADLISGKVPASQLPEITPVTDSTIAPLINGATTGAAIDARINTQVAPQVQKITADYIAGDRTVADAAAAAVNANPKIVQLETVTIPKALADANSYTDETKWFRGTVTSGSANEIRTPGRHTVTTANVTDLPLSVQGHLDVLPTQFPVQIFTPWGRVGQYQRWTVNNVWQPWQMLQHYKGEPSVPLNDLKDPGEYFYAASNTANSPFPGAWVAVTVKRNGSTSNVFQTAHSSGAKPQVATRTWSNSSKTWTDWSYFVLGAKGVEYLTADSLAGAVSGLGGNGNGTKLVPLAMTQMGTGTPQPTDQGAVRWSRRYAVAPTRVRVHLANYNAGWSPWTGSDIQIASIRVGKGTAEGAVEGAVTVAATGSIPGQSGEYVSRWVDLSLQDGDHVALTVAWTGGDGTTTNLQIFQGGGWTAGTAGSASSPNVDGWTRTQTTPFFAWLEAEVPATTPVVLGHGTSTVTGTASADPVGDSFVSKYAYSQGSLPVLVTHHGSTMTSWSTDAVKWDQYPGVNLKSIVDATITYAGGNDLAVEGMTAAEMQTRMADYLKVLQSKVKGPVYVGLLSPSNKPASVEVVRRTVNTWLKGLPSGIRGTFDFPLAIGDAADEDLEPAYSADGLHPNAAGQQRLADLVSACPVTPFALAPSKLKALAALL